MTRKDRRRGMFLGLAIGDALGAPVEFQPPGTFRPVTGYQAGGPHNLEAGEWTDDTSMALALADSIAESGWDLEDQAQRYVTWWRTGAYSVNGRVFDIGTTTVAALQRFVESGDPWSSGDPSARASGNGSIMRLAPVPIAYARLYPKDLGGLVRRCVESSVPTHASASCLSTCAVLGVLLAALAHGTPREEVLSPTWPFWGKVADLQPLHPEVEEILRGSYRRRNPPEIYGGGYTVRCLEAALWAFIHADSFHDAVLAAVNLGNDADTTGAVCGQIAGAYWGESGIPKEWLAGLAEREQIEKALRGLLPSGETS